MCIKVIYARNIVSGHKISPGVEPKYVRLIDVYFRPLTGDFWPVAGNNSDDMTGYGDGEERKTSMESPPAEYVPLIGMVRRVSMLHPVNGSYVPLIGVNKGGVDSGGGPCTGKVCPVNR